MRILFITKEQNHADIRTRAMLLALADAGYQVDVWAPSGFTFPHHSNIRSLDYVRGRLCGLNGVLRREYKAVHAVGDSVWSGRWLAWFSRAELVYDARCRFSNPSIGWKKSWRQLFPRLLRRNESRLLNRTRLTLVPGACLEEELRSIGLQGRFERVEEVPAQALRAGCPHAVPHPASAAEEWGSNRTKILFEVLPPGRFPVRKLLLVARKLLRKRDDLELFFVGLSDPAVRRLAKNLEVDSRCHFLGDIPVPDYLNALEVMDLALLVPPTYEMRIHPRVYTLLYSGVPMITLPSKAYDSLLTEDIARHSLPNPDSMADTVLSLLDEPLFARSIAEKGRSLVTRRYTFSNFKHRVRMAYLALEKR